ncbi:MAG: uroporphyrinogen decarboxylase family protein [Armatimonadota bacterium]
MSFIPQSTIDEIERRKEVIRRVWDYKRVDHIPIAMRVAANPWGYTTREHFLDAEKQFAIESESVKLSLELIPDDYIPSMRVDVGCVVIESALGAEIVFGDDPNQTCNVREPILHSVDDIYNLKMPNPHTDGLVPEGLRRIKLFTERTDGQVYVSCLDMGGAMNVAFTLLGGVQFYMTAYDHPEALDHLSSLITDCFILFAEECIKAAGGIEHVTSTDFPYIWQPEGRKGHCSDDISAQFSPDFFNRFSKPHNNRIFARFGGGMLHNCGPNPCAGEYLSHDPPIKAVDLAYEYSKNDLPAFKEAFAGKGIIYFNMPADPAEYRRIMEALAPDVIAIPEVAVSPDQDVKGIYQAFLEVSREYASRMNWR